LVACMIPADPVGFLGARPEGLAPGQLYFTAVARCERAWNKSPPDVVGEWAALAFVLLCGKQAWHTLRFGNSGINFQFEPSGDST